MAEEETVVEEEVVVDPGEPQVDWTLEQWDVWAENLPEGKVKKEYFSKKSKGEAYEYSDMTGKKILVEFPPPPITTVAELTAAQEAAVVEDEAEDVGLVTLPELDIETFEEEEQGKKDILEQVNQQYLLDEEALAEEEDKTAEELAANAIKTIAQKQQQIYSDFNYEELLLKSEEEVEKSTVTGGGTGFGEMGMGGSNVVTTKSRRYEEFEEDAKIQVQKDYAEKYPDSKYGFWKNIEDIPESLWKPIAQALWVENAQKNQLKEVAAEENLLMEGNENWLLRFSSQYYKDKAKYLKAREITSTHFSELDQERAEKIEQIGNTRDFVASTLETDIQNLKTNQSTLEKSESRFKEDTAILEQATLNWNEFMQANPDVANYGYAQIDLYNKLKKDVEDARSNYKNSLNIFTKQRDTYVQTYENAKASEQKYFKVTERLNRTIGRVPIDSYALIADITSRSYDNLDVAVNKFSATALEWGKNIAQLNRIGQQKLYEAVFSTMDMDGELATSLAEGMAIEATGGAATTAGINWAKDKVKELRGSVRENISATEIDSLSDLGGFMIDLFSEQAFNTAMTATTGGAGLVLMGLGAAGGKMESMKEQEGEMTWNTETGQFDETKYNPWQYMLSGTVAFGAEYITEKVSLDQFKSALGVFRKGKKLAKGKVLDLKGSKYSLDRYTAGGAIYRYGKNVNTEGMAELFAELGNNLGDKYILGEDISLTQGLTEAYISGAAMSGLGFQVPVLVSEVRKAFAGGSEVKAYYKNGLQIKKISDEINTILARTLEGTASIEESTMAIEQLKSEQNKLLESNFNIVGTNNKRMDDMSNSDKRKMIDIHNEQYYIKSSIDKINANTELSDESKLTAIQAKKDQFNRLDSIKSRVIAGATFSADIARENKLENQKLIESGLGDKLQSITGNKELDTKENAIRAIEETEIDAKFLEDYIKGKEITKEQAVQELKKAAITNIENLFQEIKDDKKFTHHAFQTGTEFGIPMSIAIKENALEGNQTVMSHERGHASIFRKLIDGDADAFGLVKDLESYVKKRYKNAWKVFEAAKKTYKGENQLKIQEEKLAALTDFMRMNNLKSDLSLRGKLLNRIKKIRNKGTTNELSEIRTGEDVFNLLLSFTSSYEKGEMSGLAAKVMKGEVGVKTTTEAKGKRSSTAFSKSDFNIQDETSANKKKRQDTRNVAVQKIYDKHAKGKTKKEWKEFLQTPEGVAVRNEMITDYMPDMIAIAKNKGFENPMDSAFEGIDPLIKHIEAFNPETNNNLAGYVGAYLGLKVGTGAKKVRSKSDTKSIEVLKEKGKEIVDAPVDTKESTKQPKAIKLKDRLGDKAKKIDKEVKKKSKTIDLDKVNFKTLKDLTPKLTQEMFGVTPKPGNLTKADVRNAQQFIVKNWETLLAMLPEGSTPSGTATGVQKVLLDAFYTKGKRTKAAKTGSKAGLQEQTKKDNITKEQFLEVFGITPAGQPNIADRNTSSRVKAMISQTGRMLTNQAVREQAIEKGETVPSKVWEGKSKTMFSKELNKNQENKYAEISNVRDINDAGKIADIKEPITVNNDNRSKKQKLFLLSIIQQGLNSQMFKAGSFASSGAIRARVGGKNAKLNKFLKDNNIKGKKGDVFYALDNGKWVKAETQKQLFKKGITNLLPSRGRLYYGVKDPAYQEALKAAESNDKPGDKKSIKVTPPTDGITDAWLDANKDKMENNMEVLENVVFKLNDAVNNGIEVINEETGKKEIVKMPKDIAAMVIAQGYQATGGLIKIAAPFKYRSEVFEYAVEGKQSDKEGKKYREEHNPPASVIGASIILAIANNQARIIMPFIKSNYYQIQLSKADDTKLDQANLGATLPIGASILTDPILRLIDANINLNSIINPLTGKSIVEQYDAAVDVKYQNDPNVSQLQNRLIKEKLSGENVNIQKELKAYLPIASSKNITRKINVKTIGESQVKSKTSFSKSPSSETIRELGILDKALQIARDPNAPVKKIRVFDFDDTLARTKSKVLYTMPDGKKGKITPAEFAKRGNEMEAEGATWDFSEFSEVIDGKKGPLFTVAEKIQAARGTEDVFVLTARPQEAAGPIQQFLKSIGLSIPLGNITGLADSSPLAKSGWVVDKAAEGYNDFYFADDHMANVNAVKKVLDVIDVKGKVQQAKVRFSKSIDEKFNEIIEDKTGIEAFKEFSPAKARLRGKKKGKFKFFVPPSADDFVGLLYHMLSGGKKGDAQMAWFKENLLDPYARAMADITRDRTQMIADFKALKKNLKNIPKNLRKEAFDGYTYENVVRIYAWNKQGESIPGLSKADLARVEDFIANNPELQVFADQLIDMTKGSGYNKPTDSWLSGTITTDLMSVLNNNKRKLYLKQWQDNVDLIFSDKNLNKLEAAFGSNYREALENMLHRMETGSNRGNTGTDRIANRFLDYVNNSVGIVMFFNMRSALLQTISAVNFINWSDNNMLAAGKAFANQPQFWKDFMTLMNSDFLVDRRQGLKINVSESEIADAAATSKNKAKGVVAYLLKKGFLPTQFADSFAIASGGSTFYRNRLNKYKKEGLSEKEAAEKAFNDFREIAEESQQSSRPDRISQQQAGPLGRLILSFQNTPMQYTRLIKKATLDLVNGRGDWKSNVSRIVYYAAIQNVIFNALQSALFALAWGEDDDEEEEKEGMSLKEKKTYGILNSMLDSVLRGAGIAGGVLSVLKNMSLEIYERSGRKRPEYSEVAYRLLDISPPIDIKISKLKQAANNYEYNQDLIESKGFAIDNPAWLSLGLVIAATTNVPLDRLILKMNNVKYALDSNDDTWKRVAALLGYQEWQLRTEAEQELYKKSRKAEKAEHKSLKRWEVIDGDEIEALSKRQQNNILQEIGLTDDEIKELKYEADRVNKILEEYDKDQKKVTKILDKRGKDKELTEEEVEYNRIEDQTKAEQVKTLTEYGLTKKEIRDLKYEDDRIKKILELQED